MSQPRKTRHDVRLTLNVSLSPDRVHGTVCAENGVATDFEGWLGLAHAVASAAGRTAGASGSALLGGREKAGA